MLELTTYRHHNIYIKHREYNNCDIYSRRLSNEEIYNRQHHRCCRSNNEKINQVEKTLRGTTSVESVTILLMQADFSGFYDTSIFINNGRKMRAIRDVLMSVDNETYYVNDIPSSTVPGHVCTRPISCFSFLPSSMIVTLYFRQWYKTFV